MFIKDEIRNDFPMFKNFKSIYFDNAATTFKPQVVIDTVNDYYTKYNCNVHRGDYTLSFNVSKAYDEARKEISRFINCSDEEVIFTSGTTHALSQVSMYVKEIINEDSTVLTTLLEHASNILPIFDAVKSKKASIEYIKVDSQGNIDLKHLKALMNEKVKVVSISHVSNVLGCIQPIKEIAKIVHEFNAILIVDGAQSAPHMKIDVKELGVDFFCFSAHKMCGPNGVGALYGKKELIHDMKPLIYGGGSNARFYKNGDLILKTGPERFESGTPNIEGVLGFASAVRYLGSLGMDNIHARELALKKYMIDKLSDLDNVIIYNKDTASAIVTFNIRNVFAQDAASYLNSKNICVRSGNHCAKLIGEIIGKNESIRASMYFYNTFDEIDAFVKAVKSITLENTIDIFF